MIYLEAPSRELDLSRPSLFLAGGIQGCSDWQKKTCTKIEGLDLTVLNPRRENFPIHDPSAAFEQIKWEFDMLRSASMISFWFCKETLCPIVLFELGSHCMTSKPIVIGLDIEYEKRQDVETQMKIVRPDIQIVYSLDDLAVEITHLYNMLT